MALVPYRSRASAFGALVTAARTAYRYRNVLSNTYNAMKRTYGRAFGYTSPQMMKRRRTTAVRGRKWLRSKRTHYWKRKRNTSYRRANRVLRPTRNRRRGRRVPPNHDIIMRTNTRYATTFKSTGAEIDFASQKIELDAAGTFFPNSAETSPLNKCLFDTANAKRIKSVHVYMKNITFNSWYTDDQKKVQVNKPADTYVFTYAALDDKDMSGVDVEGAFIRNNGIPKKLVRNQANFHSVLRSECYARNTTSRSFSDMSAVVWKDFTREQNMFNRTGGGAENPHMNIDFFVNVDTPYLAADTGTEFQCKMEYDLCIATKWRLYGVVDSAP